MSVPNVLRVQCNFCSRFHPSFRVHKLTRAQTICDDCFDWHHKALEVLAGAVPDSCQSCGVKTVNFVDNDPTAQTRMYLVPRDGIYQILCRNCVETYLPKRADLYRGTEFGSKVLKLV